MNPETKQDSRLIEIQRGCALCLRSSQWVQQLGQMIVFHPLFACENDKSPNCGHWMSMKGICTSYEHSEEKKQKFQNMIDKQSQQKSKLIKVPTGAVKKLLKV